MSENWDRDYSKYDVMTTEELEEILRLDASAPEGEDSDTELLLYVMGVLANRRKNNSTGKTALEAWESFQQNYLPEEEECAEAALEVKKPVRRANLLPRRLIAAAAVIALVVCIPVTAKAFSWEDIWEIFARWAKETFSFVTDESAEVSEPSPEYDGEYTSLQDVLRANKRDADIVPTWVPERFSLDMVEKDITPVSESYCAWYSCGEEIFRITVQSYVEGDPEKIEINEELIEIYESSDVEYYIFSNNVKNRAVWIKDSYECLISGDLTIEEIKMMIDSIGKG